jgi:NADPH:quinone reductase-like Zn-dependent oxidoreductase
MTRAYSITAEAIAAERKRVNDEPDRIDITRVIALDTLELRPVGPRDVRLRILAVSAEHNLTHAATADTVNIAELRGGKIYPGNSAVGEVVEVGRDVARFKAGDVVVTHCNGEPDAHGYPLRIWAYDQPESIGWYAEEAVVGDWQIVPAPLACGLDLWEIAALPLRAPTAYHLWRRAEGIFRVKVSEERLATLNVMGFGGGVSELFLMLAKHRGHNAFFCSGSPERRAALEAQGIVRHRPEALQPLRRPGRRQGVRRRDQEADGAGRACTSCAICCAARSSRRASRRRRAKASTSRRAGSWARW